MRETSALEVIEGLSLPSDGSARVLRADPYHNRASIRLHLGIMLQSNGLSQQLTVQETMRMWAGTCSLACALLGKPSVLFLDEPTTGLEPESRRRVWNLPRTLKKGDVTIVLTTRNPEEAETLCDRLGTLHQSRMRREGTVSELIAAYPSRFAYRDPELAAETIASGGSPLTEREAELLRLASEGLSVDDIARRRGWV